MSKLLYISNIAGKRMAYNFSGAAIEAAHSLNYEFYSVANRSKSTADDIRKDEAKYAIKLLHIDVARNPLALQNYKAYKQLVNIIKDNKIDYIHCNTPIGGLLGRIAGKKCGVKKVVYQAHGFHFYKGAPKINWLVYYPIEKWLARYTDALITINSEDFELAKNKFKLRRDGKVYYVPGVGIDTSKYNISKKIREEKRRELGLCETDVALISMGDLIERKNYDTAIRAIAEANNPALQYYICGKGPEEENLKALADGLGVSEQIHFLGFRSDIKELLTAVDVFLFTTKQEGLPRSMMEAMASGLPCIVSKIRGNIDLIKDGDNGFLYLPEDVDGFVSGINRLVVDDNLRRKMGENNLKTIFDYDISKVKEKVRNIYDLELAESGGGGVTLNEFIQSLYEYYPLWAKKRIELNIPLEAFVLISVGELNKNKNNCVIISAIGKLRNENIHYILCGSGDAKLSLQAQADSAGLHSNVHFLGYRKDVNELYETADCFVMPSFREGLSRSIMEAMASGLPCVVSKIRGNMDLIEDEINGFLCEPTDIEALSQTINLLSSNTTLQQKVGINNIEKIKNFDHSVIECEIKKIYGLLNNN